MGRVYKLVEPEPNFRRENSEVKQPPRSRDGQERVKDQREDARAPKERITLAQTGTSLARVLTKRSGRLHMP